MELEEAVVLVTGASSGIGRATALAFDRAGARVSVAARRRERLEEIAGRMRAALVVPTDLSIEGQASAMVERTLEHFGRVDVLINNAGVAIPTTSDSLDPRITRQVLETNLIGAMIATRKALPSMLKQGHGHIINICSPAGFLGVPLMADYCASKAAMSGWTRALQAEWLGSEIQVTEYLPGLIDSELGQPRDSTEATSSRPSGGGTGPLAALPPEHVADQLVDCVRRPRAVMYSSFGARVMCWVMESARFRCLVGSRIGNAQRKQLGLPVFSVGPDDWNGSREDSSHG